MTSLGDSYVKLDLETRYDCPHCKAPDALDLLPFPTRLTSYMLSKLIEAPKDRWSRIISEDKIGWSLEFLDPRDGVWLGTCRRCGKVILFCDRQIVYPLQRGIAPAEDMPDNIRTIFLEAQSIISLSPRSACALLRICLERIVQNVAEERQIAFASRDNLYNKILKLNLPPKIQQLCDACRFAGNENAHTGELDLSGRDTEEIAAACSMLVNVLVQLLISPTIQADRVLQKLGKK